MAGSAVAVARAIVGAVPSALLVVAVFFLAVLALMSNADRRAFVLQIVDRLLALAAVLVGFPPGNR